MEGDKPKLPTIGEAISEWLGVQLPSVSMPQTLKNADKAISKVVLALGQNWETHIRARTAKAQAIGKIDVEGLYRNDEEKRKLENRMSTTKIALDELQQNPPLEDADSDVEDDWLNIFARLAEDKSSEELQILFGRILSGEIRRPGSFSLRTLQLVSTLTKADAERVSLLMSYLIDEAIIPSCPSETDRPSSEDRIFLEEIGIGGHSGGIGGFSWTVAVPSQTQQLIVATKRGLVVTNGTGRSIEIEFDGQLITMSGKELFGIANPPEMPLDFLRHAGYSVLKRLRKLYLADVQSGLIAVEIVSILENAKGGPKLSVIEKLQHTDVP